MTPSQSISIATFLITAVFAAMVLNRWRAQPGLPLLLWGTGMVVYSVGALCQAVLAVTWNEFLFRLWYWTGALMVAPWIGQGTLFLLVKHRWLAWGSFWIIALLGLIGLALVFTTGVDPTQYRPGVDLTEQFRAIFTATGGEKAIRTILVIALNIYGTVLFVGGALYSAWLLWRKTILPNRMMGNVMIVAGGLLPALGGTLILLGRPEYKYLAQLLGSALLFAGFLMATAQRPAAQTAGAAAVE